VGWEKRLVLEETIRQGPRSVCKKRVQCRSKKREVWTGRGFPWLGLGWGGKGTDTKRGLDTGKKKERHGGLRC